MTSSRRLALAGLGGLFAQAAIGRAGAVSPTAPLIVVDV